MRLVTLGIIALCYTVLQAEKLWLWDLQCFWSWLTMRFVLLWCKFPFETAFHAEICLILQSEVPHKHATPFSMPNYYETCGFEYHSTVLHCVASWEAVTMRSAVLLKLVDYEICGVVMHFSIWHWFPCWKTIELKVYCTKQACYTAVHAKLPCDL